MKRILLAISMVLLLPFVANACSLVPGCPIMGGHYHPLASAQPQVVYQQPAPQASVYDVVDGAVYISSAINAITCNLYGVRWWGVNGDYSNRYYGGHGYRQIPPHTVHGFGPGYGYRPPQPRNGYHR